MGTMTEQEEKTSEGQAGFAPNRSCVDHMYTLGKIVQGRKDAGLQRTVSRFTEDVRHSMEKWAVEKLWEIGI